MAPKSVFDSNHPFVGRILARSVRRPHIVSSLKRYFAHAEVFVDPEGLLTELYGSASSGVPLNSSADVPILAPRTRFDGSTPSTPYAFVYQKERSSITEDPGTERPRDQGDAGDYRE
ncbi:hypothetical protein B0H17DRAFT_1204336 [Mycena rosella]|uniref:Uncharacterized protein n=1 Tax=Mycena rosella TaxID=1033263 RepID=A0AAD7D9C8_MYCRO|nr:hypothetical protein B0H17DRAFT_1204336 [Mycena rosella]